MTTATPQIEKTSKSMFTIRATGHDRWGAYGKCYNIAVYAEYNSMAEAHAAAEQGGPDLVAIYIGGHKIVTGRGDATLLHIAGIEFSYICESFAPNGKRHIVTIPTN